MTGLEGAEPARIDNMASWGGRALPSKGSQSAAAPRVDVRVRRCLRAERETLAAKPPVRASTGCLRAVPSSRSSPASRPLGHGA